MVILLLLVTGVVVFLIDSLTFDRLLEYQHDNYFDQWVSDGKPKGMFYSPKGASVMSFWRSAFAMTSEINDGIPAWAENDKRAIALIFNVRKSHKLVMFYLVLFFPMFVLAKVFF